MQFSVLITVYNTLPHLDACVRSFLAQTYTDFELILVDDGSTDGSGALCDRFAEADRRVRVLHTENRGVFLARAFAESHARGDYLLHADGDDTAEPTLLETLHGVIGQRHPDLLFFDFTVCLPDGTAKRESFAGEDTFYDKDDMHTLYRLLLTTRFNSLCNKCFHRRLIDRAPEYLHLPRLRHGEDLLRSAYLVTGADNACYVHASFYNYRKGAGRSGAFHADTLPLYDVIDRKIESLLRERIAWDDTWQAAFCTLCRCQLLGVIRAVTAAKYPPKDGAALLRKHRDCTLFRCALDGAPDTLVFRLLRRGRYRTLLRLYRIRRACHAQ